MTTTFKIRGHHLLCIQGYQGYGYSKEFRNNMERLHTLIKTDPDLEFELCEANDSLCAFCPNVRPNGCGLKPDSDRIIRQMDRAVLTRLALRPGAKLQAWQLLARTQEVFQTKTELYAVCGECRWQEVCLFYQAKR